MEREVQSPSYQRITDIIQRANQIATSTQLDALLDQMLELFVEVADANAGTLYLYDPVRNVLVFKVVKGDPSSQGMVGTAFPAERGLAGAALQGREPIFIPDVEQDARWDRRLGELSALRL